MQPFRLNRPLNVQITKIFEIFVNLTDFIINLTDTNHQFNLLNYFHQVTHYPHHFIIQAILNLHNFHHHLLNIIKTNPLDHNPDHLAIILVHQTF